MLFFPRVEDIRQTIARSIGQARRRQGLSQAVLAKALGVDTSQISDWETGKNLPRIDWVVAMAKELGTSIDMLVMGEQPFIDQVVAMTEGKFADRFADLERQIGEVRRRSPEQKRGGRA